MPSPLSSNLFGSPIFTEMDSSESPFTNLDVWCDWSGDPTDTVHVCLSVEVWCTPNSEITLLDTSHPCLTQVVDSALSPVVTFKSSDNVELLQQDTDTESGTCDSPVPDYQAQVPVTPEKQTVPVTPGENTPHATLHPGYPNLQVDTHTPSDSGSVLRNGHTPDGSPGVTLDAFYASFYRDSSSSEFQSEVGQSPTNPRKRNAKAASLPDSVTDSERSYGGQKLKNRSRALAKGRESPAPSTSIASASSTSNHSRTRSLIPRPVSVMNQGHPDPTKIPLPTDSVPVLDVEFRRFETVVSPVERESQENHVQVEHESVAEAFPGDTLTPLASPTTWTSLDVSNGDTGKPLQNGQDMEKLSTVASAGSPCDMTLVSESVDTAFGGIPTQGICLVQPPTPPRTFNRPRLVLVDQVYQIQCPSDIEPARYKASVDFVLCLQPGRPRGWYELVVPGLPRLSANDHGYVYLRIPDNQGLEYRTMHFKRYEILEGCLIAQFPLIQSKLVIPLRPCDVRFYGFLRDFKVNQTIRTQVIAYKHNSAFCTVEYTAVCSLDLIQRDFWAEQCGFYLYIHGGPEGEYSCHLKMPKTDFQTIQLDSNPESEVGVTQLQVICTPLNLDMFVVTWETRLARAEANSWMPRITASLEGYHVEEGLQKRYLDAEDDEHEIVRGEVKSKIVTPKRSPKRSNGEKGFMPLVMKMFLWFMTLVLLLQPVAYSAGLYDGVLRDGAGQGVRDILCAKSKLCVGKSSLEQLGVSDPGVSLPVPEAPDAIEVLAPVETVELVPSPVLEEIDLEPQEPIRLWTPTSLRDRVDWFLGWRGPLPVAGD